MTDYSVPEKRLEAPIKDKRPRYTPGEAVTEANRCIYCVDAPCIKACPTGIDIPTFIHKIATGNTRGAARTILDANILGVSCSRVCPVEVLCVGDCVYNHFDGREPINIGRLQRFATEAALEAHPDLLAPKKKPSTGKHIVCVGGGPASFAAAAYLALDGHKVTILERKELPGGLNTLGIAPYKFKADDSLEEIKWLMSLGDIELKTGVEVSDADAADLLNKYDAVFLGLGLGKDSTLGFDGEDGDGVWGAVDLIEKIKTDGNFEVKDKRAVVIGGGNTAIDIAHELALIGVPEVYMVYRRGREAMSAYVHEVDWGRADGVRLRLDTVPLGYVRDDSGKLTGVKFAEAKDGRAVDGTEYTMDCDLVALAIGQARLTGLAKAFGDIELDAKGRVVVDEDTCRTKNSKVYAGGDCVNGGKEVVNAAEHGKRAARAITASFA